MKRLGLDIGSTTIKCVVMDENNKIVYSSYERHLSKITEKTAEVFQQVFENTGEEKMCVSISGSAGMGIADYLEVNFVQEVFATKKAVNLLEPKANVVIELGGEDAKILFLTDGFEMRMNGNCAGGTGAFIDQMATLIGETPERINELAKKSTKIYPIASRCGVFAKSDIQPLLNQGVSFENISASILKAVVNQTIGGLAQGRKIDGTILYLGGPLTYIDSLRLSFNQSLGKTGYCPKNSLYFVAIGSALQCNEAVFSLPALAEKAGKYVASSEYNTVKPLFNNEKEYAEFCQRHESNSAHVKYIDTPKEKMYLGIDAGSTTIKAVVADEDGNILDSLYRPNKGNPVAVIKDYLTELYTKYPDISFGGSAVTGYGEDLIKSAFGVDIGIVETVAHYTAAKKFKPDVDFIIDIGGQDIKCFKIHNNTIDNIFLNEACSSGCGSFLQTFAEALNYDIKDFSKIGLFAEKPVDLGSRCTVFMNSSVKQAQKDGATVEDISAGLSFSVVKNALYKVIRCTNTESLGKNIVVQGGTFLNDAVLRAFEQELNRDVVRPNISGIMGAYGAALYASERMKGETSKLICSFGLSTFKHNVKTTTCKGCNNNCQLTINSFGGKDTYIAGNKCDRPIANKKSGEIYNLYEYKRILLSKYRSNYIDPDLPTVGIPLALNMYELLPFWYTFFRALGFNIIVSPDSTMQLYVSGQHTIPSDTICFPAKLMHGHIEYLLKQNPDIIFYPCMSYNLNEEKGDNHYNCPVVAYYPEVIKANVNRLKKVEFIHDFVGLHNHKAFPAKFKQILGRHGYANISRKAVQEAFNKGLMEYNSYMSDVRNTAEKYMAIARKNHMPVIVLAGRPYHVDKGINHSLDKMICNIGAVVITEDSVCHKVEKFRTTVLNQWTYHSRLYLAAKYVANSRPEDNINLVQFVSFGCGVDAITSDEVREIIEESGKIYTQIKIDEISNTGAARIRLRSLFAATGCDTEVD